MGKSTSKSLKKTGIINTAKDRKAIHLKTEGPELSHIHKKLAKIDLDKDRKLFPISRLTNKSTELGKINRLKTEPSEMTHTSEIYKKLNNISVTREKPRDSAQSSYKMEEVIGKGTFGVVYRARHLLTNEVVAIKTVLQDKRYKNRELNILKMLNHVNVVEIKHSFYTEANGEEYLNVVM